VHYAICTHHEADNSEMFKLGEHPTNYL